MRDLRQALPASAISRRFHNGLVEALARVAVLLRQRNALNRVCLSGGSFQNVYLLEHLEQRLKADGFESLYPCRRAFGRWRPEPGTSPSRCPPLAAVPLRLRISP